MKRLVPDGIAARTILVLLLGLTISHVVSMAIYYSDRTDALASLGGGQIAERIAAIHRLMEGSTEAERERVIEAVNGPTLRVAWSRDSLLAESDTDDWRARLMQRVLTLHLGDIEVGRLRVDYADAPTAALFEGDRIAPATGQGWPETMRAHMHYMMDASALERGFRVSLRLTDRTWLNFAAPLSAGAPFWSLRFVLSISVMALAVIALSIWVVRRLTAPLATFGRAAERLGVDVNAPPLPEAGPREVRQAARAFNEMQRRIRRFIDDRTRMIAAISHDLRTPITRLRLRSEFVGDAEQQEKMRADLDEMETMIASVLGFARDAAAEEPQDVLDPVALVQSVCDDMTDTGATVEFHHGDHPPIACRRLALRRALANMIDNAVKYGGRARVGIVEAEGRMSVRVDDDGPGIPDDEIEKVFEPFYRLERSRSRETGGTGLGLSVARTIAHAHGGEVVLRNLPQGGLRAEITLPR